MTPTRLRWVGSIYILACAAAGAGLVRAAQGDPGPVVKLTSEEPRTEQNDNLRAELGLLVRELARQSVLIAARDELGLQTRDQSLREPFAADGGEPLAIHTRGILDRSLHIELTDGGKNVVWSGDVPLKVFHGEGAGTVPPPTKADYRQLVEALEPLIRTVLVEALKKAGFSRPQAPVAKAPDSGDAEQLLGQIHLLPQFQAVREAHAALAAGPSAACRGQLVRGYANLGQLSMLYWNVTPKVFIARSLLYAQRMVAADPKSADALWHRAYARALAGFHADALEDLKRAAEQANGQPPPAWVKLIEPYCRFDTRALLDLAAEDKKRKPLAMFLCFLTVEYTSSQMLLLEVGRGAQEIDPLCDRVVETMAAKAGVSTGHGLSVAGHQVIAAALVTDNRLLPPEARAALPRRQPTAEQLLTFPADVAAALVKAGDSDKGEPSWGVLGRMVQEINFLNVRRAMHFQTKQLAVDANDYLRAALPLVADHPYRSFIEVMGIKDGEQPARVAQLKKQLKIVDLELQEGDMFDRFSLENEPSPVPNVNNNSLLSRHTDLLTRDMWYRYSTLGAIASWARVQLALSPDAPWAAAALIDKDWDSIKPRAVEWEKRYGYHPDVRAAFARKYIALGQTGDAERNLEAYLKKATDHWAYQMLADLYLKDGSEAKWLATLNASLEQEDLGLDHASVRVTIARHYMDRGDYQTALPYANAAAESWAHWAMDVAAECESGLGHWDLADQWHQRAAERYDAHLEWYRWCRMSGHGSLAKARDGAMAELANFDSYYLGLFQLAEDQQKAAAETFRDSFARRPFLGAALMAAAILDEQSDAAGRDAMLDKLIAAGHDQSPQAPLRESLLAEHLRPLLANTAADAAAWRDAMAKGLNEDSGIARYAAGIFLKNHGHSDLAREQWQICLRESKDATFTPMLAAIELRKLDVRGRGS